MNTIELKPKTKVLIVDDCPFNIQTVEMILDNDFRGQFEITKAYNGQIAFEKF